MPHTQTLPYTEFVPRSYPMVAKLYRVAENSYVVADDIFLYEDDGGWVASDLLEAGDLLGLITGEVDLSDFDLDADQAEDLGGK